MPLTTQKYITVYSRGKPRGINRIGFANKNGFRTKSSYGLCWFVVKILHAFALAGPLLKLLKLSPFGKMLLEEAAAGRLLMGQKELLRGKVLEMVKQKNMALKAASVMLCASYRQPKWLYAACREEGDAGLIHGNAGKRSNHRTEESIVEKAVEATANGTAISGRHLRRRNWGKREGCQSA
jgi:hypothetical protein